MPKTRQTQPGPPAETAKTTPAPKPESETTTPSSPYGKSPLSLFLRIWGGASGEDQEFIRALLHRNLSSTESFTLDAFKLAKSQWPYTAWLPSPEDFSKKDYEILKRFYLVVVEGGWLASFLENVLTLAENNRLRLPEDALRAIEDEITDFQFSVSSTIETLHDYPQVFQKEIREAIQKHPELLPDSGESERA